MKVVAHHERHQNPSMTQTDTKLHVCKKALIQGQLQNPRPDRYAGKATAQSGSGLFLLCLE